MSFISLCAGMVLTLLLPALSRRRIGFATQSPPEFADKGPAFDPRRHLSGPVQCEGVGGAVGPSVMLRYRIRLASSAGGNVLEVTDWMYLMANGTIMNRGPFFKWGFKVSELVATMRPKQERAAA